METNKTQFLTDLSALLKKYRIDIVPIASHPNASVSIELHFKKDSQVVDTNLWKLTASNLEMFRDELKKEKE